MSALVSASIRLPALALCEFTGSNSQKQRDGDRAVVHADVNEDLQEDDPRRLGIWQLAQTLNAHQLPAEVAESEPVLVVAGNPDEGTRALTVRCDQRPADDDRLWFWIDPSPGHTQGRDATPLIEADRLADAMVHICGARQIRGDQ